MAYAELQKSKAREKQGELELALNVNNAMAGGGKDLVEQHKELSKYG